MPVQIDGGMPHAQHHAANCQDTEQQAQASPHGKLPGAQVHASVILYELLTLCVLRPQTLRMERLTDSSIATSQLRHRRETTVCSV